AADVVELNGHVDGKVVLGRQSDADEPCIHASRGIEFGLERDSDLLIAVTKDREFDLGALPFLNGLAQSAAAAELDPVSGDDDVICLQEAVGRCPLYDRDDLHFGASVVAEL